jgi:23S rRNA G2069 N7-methylase RlmK/C1962 C5-methylase RlmI
MSKNSRLQTEHATLKVSPVKFAITHPKDGTVGDYVNITAGGTLIAADVYKPHAEEIVRCFNEQKRRELSASIVVARVEKDMKSR